MDLDDETWKTPGNERGIGIKETMEKQRELRILLTNDDGIHARGLHALYRRFSPEHRVEIVAPDRQRSAVGHSITLHKPIRCDQIPMGDGAFGYAVNGTPADCVKLAVLELLESRPDLVISGINPGANTGFNVHYSGTVCAALEAGYYGIPAVAVSMPGEDVRYYDDGAAFVAQVVERMFRPPGPGSLVLNINIPDIPARKIAGVRYTRLETSLFEERFERRLDPRNRAYYWQGCEHQKTFSGTDTDGAALHHRYITLTPIRSDITDREALATLKGWRLRLHGRT